MEIGLMLYYPSASTSATVNPVTIRGALVRILDGEK
jgi:hypothetical protein